MYIFWSIKVNLGIIDANPSSTAGTIDIMDNLHRYVPTLRTGRVWTMATHGDALAVERMVDSKNARAADLSPTDRLEGLEPVPQEFHHRGLMLQVCIALILSINCEYAN